MRVYRLHIREYQAGSVGYTFFTSKREAEQAKHSARWTCDDVEATALDGPYEIKLTKAGVLNALNFFSTHPDNG